MVLKSQASVQASWLNPLCPGPLGSCVDLNKMGASSVPQFAHL